MYSRGKSNISLVAAYLASVYWTSFTLARLISIPLAIRLKPIQMLFVLTIGCLSSLGRILLFTQSLIFLVIGTAGVGIFIADVFPISLSFLENRLGVTGQIHTHINSSR